MKFGVSDVLEVDISPQRSSPGLKLRGPTPHTIHHRILQPLSMQGLSTPSRDPYYKVSFRLSSCSLAFLTLFRAILTRNTLGLDFDRFSHRHYTIGAPCASRAERGLARLQISARAQLPSLRISLALHRAPMNINKRGQACTEYSFACASRSALAWGSDSLPDPSCWN
jgi:hypothetical protein